jgi:uncharacterized protein (UPF0305 family)
MLIENQELFKDLDNLILNNTLTQNNLLETLKKYSQTVSMFELAIAINTLLEEGKYVQKSYMEALKECYIPNFILRIKEVNSDKKNYPNSIDKESFSEAVGLLKNSMKQEGYDNRTDKFPLIYSIISLYTTYILDEPIHKVGSEFPGHQYVTEENGIYHCPIKKNHEDDPVSVCKFCIAEPEKN